MSLLLILNNIYVRKRIRITRLKQAFIPYETNVSLLNCYSFYDSYDNEGASTHRNTRIKTSFASTNSYKFFFTIFLRTRRLSHYSTKVSQNYRSFIQRQKKRYLGTCRGGNCTDQLHVLPSRQFVNECLTHGLRTAHALTNTSPVLSRFVTRLIEPISLRTKSRFVGNGPRPGLTDHKCPRAGRFGGRAW